MAAFFSDRSASLRNLVSYDGYKSLVFDGEEMTLAGQDPLGLCLVLMMEVGVTPEARRGIRATRSKVPNSRRVRQWMHSLGKPRGGGPCSPGDLISWSGQPEGGEGVVVAVDSSGNPEQVMTLQNYALTLIHKAVAADSVYEVWTPDLRMRESPGDFYGEYFFSLVGDPPGSGGVEHYRFKGREYTLIASNEDDFARLLSLKAPDEIKQRIWKANGLREIQEAIDTYGEGVEDHAPDKVRVGTWLLGRSSLEVVVTLREDGQPAVVLQPGQNGSVELVRFSGKPASLWNPATSPRVYWTGTAAPGVLDANALIGRLRLWDQVELNDELFRDADLLEYYSKPVARLLKSGPLDDWPSYFNENGGLLPVDGGTPGDLLLGPGDTQGVLLDKGEALTWNGTRLSVRKVPAKARRWRPQT